MIGQLIGSRKAPGLILGILLALPLTSSAAAPIDVTATQEDMTDRLIIKYRIAADGRMAAGRISNERGIAARSGLAVQRSHRNALGADILKLDRKLTVADAAQLARDIAQNDPTVEYAEPDRIMHPMFTPSDPRYNEQWHYFESAGGISLPAAWDVSTGAGIRVAVIDTGYRPHADLAANVLPGYDFISDVATANDGNGRDNDAQDPGDACAAFGQPSSWHGTHVAGTVAAVTNNGNGVAGVAFNARVVPVRVLGVCGGFESDIADGIIWASGGSVTGIPNNPNPARVLNLSLGTSGPAACSATYQNAINSARTRNSVVVVSAGNSNTTANHAPGNCGGVITVAATSRSGGKAFYSNFGSLVELAAPGGETSSGAANGVLSTLNTGTSAPGIDTYAFYQGTSMAAPHVSGVAALILSQSPTLTPDDVLARLQSSARPFPAACGGCGSGIVNAQAALTASPPPPPPPPSTTPDAPKLSESQMCNGSYSLSWTRPAQPVTAYELYGSANPSFSPQQLVYSGLGTSRTVFAGPFGNTSYYRVRACNGGACSVFSNTVILRGFTGCN